MYYIGGILVKEVFCGNNLVKEIYLGSNRIYPNVKWQNAYSRGYNGSYTKVPPYLTINPTTLWIPSWGDTVQSKVFSNVDWFLKVFTN